MCVDMPSGTTVWPFANNPRITQEGFVLHGPTKEFRARVYRFLLNREIHCPITPCVRENIEWQYVGGDPVASFPFPALEHLSFQGGSPITKRRAANLIPLQPPSAAAPPSPPVFPVLQAESAQHTGAYASQAARPSVTEDSHMPGAQCEGVQLHQLPYPSLVQDAVRRVVATRQEAATLLRIIQANPLANHPQEHYNGIRACQTVHAEMDTLEDALAQLP